MAARVLITGARGGIGTAAMLALRARGARVVGLDRGRRALDRVLQARLARLARNGHLDDSPLAAPLGRRLRDG
jgi:nucleoside-diphosphate-sugar epimerase